jgi:transformation/transcription domain-associated protein
MLDKMPLIWLLEHQLKFISALLYVMFDLTDEVSYGTVSIAKDCLERLLRQCNSPLKTGGSNETEVLQAKVFPQVAERLVQESIALNQTVREQVL